MSSVIKVLGGECHPGLFVACVSVSHWKQQPDNLNATYLKPLKLEFNKGYF